MGAVRDCGTGMGIGKSMACSPNVAGVLAITISVTGCPNDCSGKGRCNEGVCECVVGYTYFDCSLSAPRPLPCAVPHPITSHGRQLPMDVCSPSCSLVLRLCRNLPGRLQRRHVLQWCVQVQGGVLWSRLQTSMLPQRLLSPRACTQIGARGICQCEPGYGGLDCSYACVQTTARGVVSASIHRARRSRCKPHGLPCASATRGSPVSIARCAPATWIALAAWVLL